MALIILRRDLPTVLLKAAATLILASGVAWFSIKAVLTLDSPAWNTTGYYIFAVACHASPAGLIGYSLRRQLRRRRVRR